MRTSELSTIAIELPDSKGVKDLHLPDKPAIKNGKIAVVTEKGQSIITKDETPEDVYAGLKKIAGRGNSTWELSGRKRPYLITLEEKASLIEGTVKAKNGVSLQITVAGLMKVQGWQAS